MKHPQDIVKSMIRTEKGSVMMAEGKYIFWVADSSNKIEIKSARFFCTDFPRLTP